MAKKKKKDGPGVIASNRKARHDYTILDTYEAGVVLQGTEIKSLRDGKASLVEAYATIDDGEVWLRNLHIPEYSMGSWTNHSPNGSPATGSAAPSGAIRRARSTFPDHP